MSGLKYLLLFFSCIILISCSDKITGPVQQDNNIKTSEPIEPYPPIPSTEQYDYEKEEVALFLHFGMNTYTGVEWGDGKADPKQFALGQNDIKQLVISAKQAGFKYVILTIKHHDGFCLWPSKYTNYTIKNSNYKNGHGDLVREFVEACKMYDVKPGLYFSIWDRHDSTYNTPTFNTFVMNQLKELCTNYGDISLIWIDGADGDHPDKNLTYPLLNFYSVIKSYQPKCIIDNMGPDLRWVGNETGVGNETEWSKGVEYRIFGNSDYYWWPSECDLSIRPGWFYHERQNDSVKTGKELFDIYMRTVGRNSNMLLNAPPDKNLKLNDADLNSLKDFHSMLLNFYSNDLFKGKKITASNSRNTIDNYKPENCLDDNENTFWVTDPDTVNASLTIDMEQKIKLNYIRLDEAIKFGQRVFEFKIYYDDNGTQKLLFTGTTIGRSRIIKFNEINTSKIKIEFTGSVSPAISSIKGFYYNN